MKQENERGIRHRPASFKEKTHHKNVVNFWVTVQQDWMTADPEAAAAHVLRLLHFQFWDVMVAFIFQWGGKSLRSSTSEGVNLKHTFILKERNSLNNVRGGLHFYGNDSLTRKLNLNKIFCANTRFGNCTFTAGKFTNVAWNLAKYETVIIATGKTSFWLMKISKKCLQQYVFIWYFYI